MKAKFFTLAALMLGLASCTQDVDPTTHMGGEVDFQLSVAAPELAGTRAGENGAADTQNAMDSAFGAIDYLQGAATGDYRQDWSDVDLRYTLEVYDKADDYTDATPIKDRQVVIVPEYAPVTFNLRLAPNRDYHFVVFADFVAEGSASKTPAEQLGVNGLRHEIGETLADIALFNEAINDEVADSYFATKDIKIVNSAAQDIVLRRPYGKLRVVATDLAELNLNVHPKSVVVEYESFNPNAFNAVTGDIEGEYAVKSFTTTFVDNVRDNMGSHYYNVGYDEETITTLKGETRNSHITLFTDYILGENVQADGTYLQTPIHFTMTVNDDKGGEIKTTSFNTDIPIERNKLTTVIGNVLTTATEVEIRIDDNFAGEFFVLWDGLSATMPEYDDATKTYTIYEASHLAWFAAQVNGTTRAATANTFEGYTVKLGKDIHLNGERWEPIGSNGTVFKGTFDGNGHKIDGLFVSTEGKASAGLFATNRGLIKNLTVVNAEVYGHYKAAVIVADGLCSRVEGCTVDNCVVVSTPYNNNDANNVGAITGYLSAEPTAYVKGCTVTNTKVTAYRKVGGIVGAANRAAEVTGNTIKACYITADMTAEYSEDKPADAGQVVGWQHADAVVENNTVGGTNVADNVNVAVKVDDMAGVLANAGKTILLNGGVYDFTADYLEPNTTLQAATGTQVVVNGNGNTLNFGTRESYGLGAKGKDTTFEINDAKVTSAGGGLAATDGAKVTFNGESVDISKYTNSSPARYNIYAATGGEIVINSGVFKFNSTNNTRRSYVCVEDGGKVIINDGTFGKASTRSGYPGIRVFGDNSEVIVYGGTFGFDPTEWVAAGCTVKKEGANWVVTKGTPATTSAELKDSIDKMEVGETVVVAEGNYGAFPAVTKNVTIYCEEGTVFEGNSKLNIKGSTVVGATFSNPGGTAVDQTINGTFKNCTFTGSNGLRWAYAGETCYFENCVFEGSTYGAHFDGGANDVVFKNCVFSGFNAFGGAITQLTLEGCTFKAGKSAYNGANLWGSTSLKNCQFEFDGTKTEFIDFVGDNKTYIIDNCKHNDVDITEENHDELGIFINYGTGNTIKINGVDCTK